MVRRALRLIVTMVLSVIVLAGVAWGTHVTFRIDLSSNSMCT
jgi:hypothetical protein